MEGDRVSKLEARQLDILRRIDALADRLAALSPVPSLRGSSAAAGIESSSPSAPSLSEDSDSDNSKRYEDSCAPPLDSTPGSSGDGPISVQARLEKELLGLGLAPGDFQFKRVPPDYYEWELEARRDVLGAPSVAHLCKSIVLKNTQAPADVTDCSNPKNSLYYVVVVQYAAKLNTEKVRSFVHSLSEGAFPKKRYNMRLAPEPESGELTGFIYNAVTPVGMKTPIPIIISHLIAELDPGFFWMGGGEVDLKLGMQVNDFIKHYSPYIVDCT